MIREQVFTYGEHQHGIGVLSEPQDTTDSPIVVLLNAGLSHRAEPYRLNVLLARELAKKGYIAVRVDLSGKGDSPARSTLTNRESVALDWSFIKKSLEKLYGSRTLLIFGLCSGADNGIKICADDPMVKGLILLDPVSRQDSGFRKRDFISRITNPYKWMRLHRILLRRLSTKSSSENSLLSSPMDLRDEPNSDDMDRCFEGLVRKNGRVLSVFTSQALYHYNSRGQFAAAMGVDGLESIIEEVFWPDAKHIFPIEAHRNRLIEKAADWAGKQLDHFKLLNNQ
jgi:hypothetical protein